mmetsp:Transcript_108698/g.350920  ORF Transcript_108698/g.350920 Transcript_108698/m.350920 type:complete len:641 (-) Transcript_108698:88-2010(-)
MCARPSAAKCDPGAMGEASLDEAFRAALAQVSAVHGQEVHALQQQVAQLRSSLSKVHSAALCAAIDEPEMAVVAREVAAELADQHVEVYGRGSALDWTNQAGADVASGISSTELSSVDGAPVPLPRCPELLVSAQVSAPEKRKSSLVSARPPTSWFSTALDAPEIEKTRTTERAVEKMRTTDRVCVRDLTKELEKYTAPAVKRQMMRQKFHGVAMGLTRSPGGDRGRVAQVIEHPAFDFLCAVMIILNSVLIGFSVEWQTEHTEENVYMLTASHVCSGFFFLELALRIYISGLSKFFITSETRNWNIFDCLLVVFSVLDVVVMRSTSGEASSVGSGMKTIKMLRIVRVFRVFRFFRELSLLALMIVDSMRSLMWALLMLAIIIYVFAICFTTSASEHLRSHEGSNSAGLSEVHRQFGSLGRTVYSLVQAMLGGVSWGVCCDALLTIDWFSGALFFFYVAFTILAVMNIITGVFVDNAVETARTQRDFLIQKEMELKEKYAQEMRDLFMEMDKDGSGTIGLEEINEYLEDPRVQGYFAALGLDPNDTERLFKLIDDDGSGDVDVGEFLDGCLRLKGQARSIDIYSLMHDMKLLDGKVDEMVAWIKEDPHLSDYARQSVRSSGNGRTPHVVTVTTTATATLV